MGWSLANNHRLQDSNHNSHKQVQKHTQILQLGIVGRLGMIDTQMYQVTQNQSTLHCMINPYLPCYSRSQKHTHMLK